jgi:hypothetical protein
MQATRTNTSNAHSTEDLEDRWYLVGVSLSLWFTELLERLDEEAPPAWVKLEMLNTSVHLFKQVFTSKLQKLAFGCVHQIMKSSSSFSLVISSGKTNGPD